MKPAKSRFKLQIDKIKAKINIAIVHDNPALWLFLNDLRTPLFQLQALARIYRKLHNKKKFEIILADTKLIEDALGKVDYYVAFQKDFAADPKISAFITEYCKTKATESLKDLSKLLKKNDWLNGKKISGIENILKKADWLKPSKESKLISEFYENEIGKIQKFMIEAGEFDDIELDVHELRRKLRWLSIYAQALQGGLKLEIPEKSDKKLQKYLTDRVKTSPFNQLPQVPDDVHAVTVNQERFLALSWIINELGVIKDQGLRVHIIKTAIQETHFLNEIDAEHKTSEILGKSHQNSGVLLSNASKFAKQFFDDRVLDNFLVE